MTADFTTLRSRSFDRAYYEEHLAAGLDYLNYDDWQYRYARWLIDCFKVGGGRVLDVGCACGNIVQAFHDNGLAAAGVDLNEHTIGLGRQRFPAVAENLHVCDAANLHLVADGSLDLVHSMQSAEHWPPQLVPAILREFARVAKPGGLLWCVLDTEELGRRQKRDLPAEDPTHVCIKPVAWWRDQLRAAGWDVCSAEFQHPLAEHGWSYFASHDWDWFVARRRERLPPDQLVAQDGWFVRVDCCFADHGVINEVFHEDCYQLLDVRPSRPDEVIVDVGACLGAFSRLAHLRNPRARIIAVEANRKNIPVLEANVAQFASVVPAALTYLEDPALLDSVWPGSLNTGISQLHPRAAVQQYSADRWVRPDLTTPLATITLEDLFARHDLDRVDLLKLDCEGSEYSILEGCRPETLERIDRIVGEYHVSRERFEQMLATRFPADRWQARYTRGVENKDQGLFWLTRKSGFPA